MEEDFFTVLFDELKKKGINHLDLRHLRPDSVVLTHLVGIAKNRGNEVTYHEDATSVELDLPPTWEAYLETLSKKQRHEVRRKLRRLWEAGKVEHRCFDTDGKDRGLMDTFLKLFALSQGEKDNFMTDQMESFFRALAEAMADIGLLRFGVLEVDTVPVAMTMSFDYNGSINAPTVSPR